MTDQDALAHGFIDLHSHLLPGVDDGCSSLEDSLSCVRQLIKSGFAGSVCTPHFWFEQFPDNVPAEIERAVGNLRGEIQRAGLQYQLWPGAEVRISADTISWFEDYGVPALGNSNCVLIDYWGNSWPEYANAVVEYLVQHHYRPILAHPERMGLDGRELESVRVALVNLGVIFQGNLNSLAGGEGKQAQQRMLHWLQENRYQLIATDMHGPMGLVGRLHAIALLEQQVGAMQAALMLGERPRAIVAG